MKTHTFRLHPNQKLRESLINYCWKNDIKAATIVGCVGGLNQVSLRMPGAKPSEQDVRDFGEDLEIVSVEGTLGTGDCHIHVSVSKKDSTVIGGHLKEGVVRITAEVTLLEFDDRQFNRELDPETGFKELVVKEK